MIDKNMTEEIKRIAKMRRNAIHMERKKAEEERERRIKSTEASLRTIGEAYQLLVEGCDKDDMEISLYFPVFCGYGDVKIAIVGAPHRCRIVFRGDRSGDFLVCSYHEDGTIDASEAARDISEGHVLKYNLGGSSREISEWIVANPDEFVTAVLMNIEHRYSKR